MNVLIIAAPIKTAVFYFFLFFFLHVKLFHVEAPCAPQGRTCKAWSPSQCYKSLPVVFLGYLCKPEDNIYNIDFVRFKIRDLETSTVLFEIAKPPHAGTVPGSSTHVLHFHVYHFQWHKPLAFLNRGPGKPRKLAISWTSVANSCCQVHKHPLLFENFSLRWVGTNAATLLCGQKTTGRTGRQTPARADLYATSSLRPSSSWGPWELREWLTRGSKKKKKKNLAWPVPKQSEVLLHCFTQSKATQQCYYTRE